MLIDMAEQAERIVDNTVAKADNVKVQTAQALEDAARKLREASIESRGEDVKYIIRDIEARTNELKAEVDRQIAPVEDFIVEHPLASIMIAAGLGFMIGSLMTRRD